MFSFPYDGILGTVSRKWLGGEAWTGMVHPMQPTDHSTRPISNEVAWEGLRTWSKTMGKKLMNKRLPVLATIVFLAVFSPAFAAGQDNPFQIALVGPTIQLVDDDEDVRGIRLNFLYGVNENVSGLDVGLVNHTNGSMSGVQFGIINLTDGGMTGWQSGVVNVSQGSFTGLQWAPWSILSLANFAEAAEGAQIAAAFNRADYMRGFQLSLVNVVDDMHGVQVGLINIIRSKDKYPVLPIVNWKFDG